MDVSFRYKTLPLITQREVIYARALNEILIKRAWWDKLDDVEVMTRWAAELKTSVLSALTEVRSDRNNWQTSRNNGFDGSDAHKYGATVAHVSDLDFAASVPRFAFAELDWLRKNHLTKYEANQQQVVITPTSAHGVFLSDSLLSLETKAALIAHSEPLELASLAAAKWHAGTNRMALDLIHPSDYCLVYGRSMSRNSTAIITGSQPITFQNSNTRTSSDTSQRFQWLPTEFAVSAIGDGENSSGNYSVLACSYINNLHQALYPDLCNDIESILATLIPMFELALGSLDTCPVPRIEAPTDNEAYQGDEYMWHRNSWIRHQYGSDADVTNKKLQDDFDNSDETDDFIDKLGSRPIALPGLPDEFAPPSTRVANLPRVILNGRIIKVIIKMASIHLTPEKPKYEGGGWHLEGMENEAIAATAIVYYSTFNITSSRLTFRNVHEDEDSFEYGQSDFAGLEKVFDFVNELTENVQTCGQIEAADGRVVVFPNFLHHRVEPFELVDKNKNGHRKILALFLVHPDAVDVKSTTNVCMQQQDWVAQDLFVHVFQHVQIPLELVRRIVQFTGGSTMTEKEAANYSNEVMEERKNTKKGGYAN
ncbi:hypothetical protein HK100_006430, partial [Physocladia obscura]